MAIFYSKSHLSTPQTEKTHILLKSNEKNTHKFTSFAATKLVIVIINRIRQPNRALRTANIKLKIFRFNTNNCID